MEDFGQIIAIIVGIIFLVINSLGKKKKPVAPPQNQNTSSPKVPRSKTGIPEIDVFLEEFSKPDEEELEYNQPEFNTAYESLETIEPSSPYAQYNTYTNSNEIQSQTNFQKLGESIIPIADENYGLPKDTKQDKLTQNFEFNLRDAVVFSEILKRPSF